MHALYKHTYINVNKLACLTSNKRGCNFPRMTYGERLAKAIKHAKLTQAKLAESVGKDRDGKLRVTQANISELLTNPRTTGSKHTAKFARICGVSEDWLAYEEGEMFDGLYAQGDKLKHLFKVAQELPEYALDDAIKRVTDLAQLLQQAGIATGQDRRRNPLPESEQEAVYGRRKTDRKAQ